MATQKIIHFREKLLHEDREELQKHFDAMIRYLQKNPKEFQEYQPDRVPVNEKLKEKTSFDNEPPSSGQSGVSVETPPCAPLPPIPYLPNTSRELEPPRKLLKLEKFVDDSCQYNDIRSKSCTRTRFASKHLMRPGTTKLRQDLIRKYLSGKFKTLYVTDFDDQELKQLFDSMGDEAQVRAKSMFNQGYYSVSKDGETVKIDTNGLVLSINPRLQLKITSPGHFDKEKGVWIYGYHLLHIDICSYHAEELQKRENGDYYHWDSHKMPQATHKAQRSPLGTLDNNSAV